MYHRNVNERALGRGEKEGNSYSFLPHVHVHMYPDLQYISAGYRKSLRPETLHRPNSVVEQQCSEKEEIFPGITGKTFYHERKETAAQLIPWDLEAVWENLYPHPTGEKIKLKTTLS